MSENLQELFAEYQRTAAINVLPKGKHKLKVTSCTVKSNGVQPVYEVVEGPDAGKRAMAGGIFPGATEGGRQAFFRKLEKFGLGESFFAKAPSLQDIAEALKGRVIEADLDVKEWNGEDRNELGFGISLISAPDAPAVGGVPTVTTQVAPAPVPQAATGTPVAASDDVPF